VATLEISRNDSHFATSMFTTSISFLLGKRRAATVQNAFRESNESYLVVLDIAERRALDVSPDHGDEWQKAFMLQRLLIKQRCLRFEHLVRARQLDESSRSIASIEDRLDKGWADTEEAILKEIMPSYKEISREIDDVRSKRLPLGKELIAALEGDSEYRQARIAFSDRAYGRRAKLGG
jgi:hypothetical protein